MPDTLPGLPNTCEGMLNPGLGRHTSRYQDRSPALEDLESQDRSRATIHPARILKWWKHLTIVSFIALALFARIEYMREPWQCPEPFWLWHAMRCETNFITDSLHYLNFGYSVKSLAEHEDYAWGNCTQAYQLSNNITLGDSADWPFEAFLAVDDCRTITMDTWGFGRIEYYYNFD